MNNNKKNTSLDINFSFIAGVFLFLTTIAIFSQAINHDFINFDDQLYITENPMVIKGLTLEGLCWAFSNISAGFWFPLTWVSHMVDCQIFGLNPGGHHFISLLLHSINTLLLFHLFRKMTGKLLPSLLVAVIFGIHPLHVEPVAWASSRKDVLSTFLWILAMWSYTRYVKLGGSIRYIQCLLFFLMGLMAKPMLVTLPFVLLLTDIWPLYRLDMGQIYSANNASVLSNHSMHHLPISVSKLILEKIPFFILSFTSVYITYIAEKGYGSVIPLKSLPFASRLSNALVSYANYVYKSILPIKLSVHYPPYESLPIWSIAISLFLFILLTFISIRFHRQHPYLLVGWLWFVGTLVPVIGLIQIGSHSMADRYAYIPLIGLSIMFSWGLYHLSEKIRLKSVFLSLICIIAVPLSILSIIQLSYWKNGISLFEHAVEIDKNNYLARRNLAFSLATNEREQEAIDHYHLALGMKGEDADIHFNMGKAFQSLKQYAKAIFHYKTALAINPDFLQASLNLGTVYYDLEEYNEAIHCFKEVLRINPNHAGAHNNLGVIMARQNRTVEAIYQFGEALRIDPENATAIRNLNKITK